MTFVIVDMSAAPPRPQVKICSQCGEEFIKKGRNNKFCSKECVDQNRRNLQQEYKNPVRFTQLEGDGELDGGLRSHPVDPSVLAIAEVYEDNRMIVEDSRRLYTIIYEEFKHTSPEVIKQMKDTWAKRRNQRPKSWDATYILGWDGM